MQTQGAPSSPEAMPLHTPKVYPKMQGRAYLHGFFMPSTVNHLPDRLSGVLGRSQGLGA